MEKIKKIIRSYWYIGVILILSYSFFKDSDLYFLLVMLFGMFFSIFLIPKFMEFFFETTLGKKQPGFWGIFRFLGAIGLIAFTINLGYLLTTYDLNQAYKHSFFKFSSLGIVLSFFLLAFGEIILYLNELKYLIDKNTNMFSKILEYKEVENERLSEMLKELYGLKRDLKKMTCPRCYGKGYVDLSDIRRLGMEKEWEQGACQYCEGEGQVQKGKTKLQNPRKTNYGQNSQRGQ